MRIGWRRSFRRYLSRNVTPRYLALEIRESGITAIVCERSSLNPNALDFVQERHFPRENWQNAVRKWVKKSKLYGSNVNVVLGAGLYQTLPVDKPSVPDDSVADALRWLTNDLIDSNQETLIDYYDVPIAVAGQSKVNVVAASQSLIEEIATGVHSSGLELLNINISDLAFADIAGTETAPIMQLIQQDNGDINLNIVAGGQLYVSRNLKGYDDFAYLSEEQIQLKIEHNLSLEVQRSMDYFEGQMRQQPVQKITVLLDNPHVETLCQLLQKTLLVPVESVSLDHENIENCTLNIENIASYGGLLSYYPLQ